LAGPELLRVCDHERSILPLGLRLARQDLVGGPDERNLDRGGHIPDMGLCVDRDRTGPRRASGEILGPDQTPCGVTLAWVDADARRAGQQRRLFGLALSQGADSRVVRARSHSLRPYPGCARATLCPDDRGVGRSSLPDTAAPIHEPASGPPSGLYR